jgi:hypothetical protein
MRWLLCWTAILKNGQYIGNVIKIRYGDLARKFAPEIAA